MFRRNVFFMDNESCSEAASPQTGWSRYLWPCSLWPSVWTLQLPISPCLLKFPCHPWEELVVCCMVSSNMPPAAGTDRTCSADHTIGVMGLEPPACTFKDGRSQSLRWPRSHSAWNNSLWCHGSIWVHRQYGSIKGPLRCKYKKAVD